jgi:hypothetical protein
MFLRYFFTVSTLRAQRLAISLLEPPPKILVGVVFVISIMCLAFARASQNSGIALQADVAELNNSGVTGRARVEISNEGLRGVLKARNLVPGHGYTVWFFYLEGTNQGGPGRFDSDVAETGEVTFHGHVGGLQASGGATIRLVIFDHPNLGTDNVTRANNLLTPAGGSAVGRAEFSIP